MLCISKIKNRKNLCVSTLCSQKAKLKENVSETKTMSLISCSYCETEYPKIIKGKNDEAKLFRVMRSWRYPSRDVPGRTSVEKEYYCDKYCYNGHNVSLQNPDVLRNYLQSFVCVPKKKKDLSVGFV